MATLKEYASTRAHQDAKDSNMFARSSAQAAMLINGGAATAILAFLSKGVTSPIGKFAAVALCVYAIGIVASAATFLTLTYSIEWWCSYWESVRYNEEDETHITAANKWGSFATTLCVTALASFAIGSFVLAWAFFNYFA